MKEIKYGGKWNLININEVFDGELFINDQQGIIRLIIYYNNPNDPWGSKAIPDAVQIINGTLTTGAKFSLLDCIVVDRHSQNLAFNTLLIDAKYAVNGHNFVSAADAMFHKMDFKVSNIIGWSGLSGFDYPSLEGYGHIVAYKFKEEITYQINDETTVSFSPHLGKCSFEKDTEEVILKQSVLIKISCNVLQKIDNIVILLNKVLGLISLGIGEKPDIISAFGYNPNYYMEFGKDKQRIEKEIQVFFNNEYKEKYKEPLWFHNLFTLTDLIRGPENLLSNWFSKYELLEPIIELYISTLEYKNMSIERHFLNIVQALETYHMRFVCNKLSSFLIRIEEMTNQLPNKDEYFNQLCDETQKSQKYVLIKSRLTDLIIADFKIHFYFSSRSKQFDFIQKVVETRHYHTHYAQNKKDKAFYGDELVEACNVLRLILEYYLLLEIGLPVNHVKEKIKVREGNIKRHFQKDI